MSAAPDVLSTRTCGTCSLCCKVFPVPEFSKPAGRWCAKVEQGKGCSIYAERPQTCRDFYCQWRYSDDLGPEWKPEVSRFVLSIYPGTNSLAVAVDPGMPMAWQQEPYLSSLRMWSEAALEQGDQVLVFIGAKVIAVLPDRAIDLGEMKSGDRIITLKGAKGYDVRLQSGGGGG